MSGPEEMARRLSAEAVAAGEPTAWFERVYAAAEAGETRVPWDFATPAALLVEWAAERDLDGAGCRAVVVGCGLGEDAEFIASRGFATIAFDISPTAVRAARRRFPDSPVRYVEADLLHLPADWIEAFDLVVENYTLQALSDPPRAAAIASVGRLAGPGGTLIAVARSRDPGDPDDGPPWALTRAEIDALVEPGLRPVRIERIPVDPKRQPWRAEFTRPAAGS
jgi:SAM-dependent methyltransferase